MGWIFNDPDPRQGRPYNPPRGGRYGGDKSRQPRSGSRSHGGYGKGKPGGGGNHKDPSCPMALPRALVRLPLVMWRHRAELRAMWATGEWS